MQFYFDRRDRLLDTMDQGDQSWIGAAEQCVTMYPDENLFAVFVVTWCLYLFSPLLLAFVQIYNLNLS